MIGLLISGPGALVGVALLAVMVAARSRYATALIYSICLAICITLLGLALIELLRGVTASLVLPLGIPWLGAHFRIDPLAAFFLVVVNLGGSVASLYGLGYGRHESSPARVLPFFPAFLAGMNLVVLADDAFSFLLAWEFMSLTSWALVVAQHRIRENTLA